MDREGACIVITDSFGFPCARLPALDGLVSCGLSLVFMRHALAKHARVDSWHSSNRAFVDRLPTADLLSLRLGGLLYK